MAPNEVSAYVHNHNHKQDDKGENKTTGSNTKVLGSEGKQTSNIQTSPHKHEGPSRSPSPSRRRCSVVSVDTRAYLQQLSDLEAGAGEAEKGMFTIPGSWDASWEPSNPTSEPKTKPKARPNDRVEELAEIEEKVESPKGTRFYVPGKK